MTANKVILGKITGVQGLKGWLKVFSDTRPADNIFQYKNWQIIKNNSLVRDAKVLEFKHQGKKLLVKLQGVSDRTEAESLIGLEIAVDSETLPVLNNEYYWRDLIGLSVKNTNNVELGDIIDLMETGSNDVLLLKDSSGKSLAIPWLPEIVVEVDILQSLMIVEWEPMI